MLSREGGALVSSPALLGRVPVRAMPLLNKTGSWLGDHEGPSRIDGVSLSERPLSSASTVMG